MKCDSHLSLLDCVDEKRIGIVSIFLVKCQVCQSIRRVETDKKHEVPGLKMHYNQNTKAVVGLYSDS